jgi:hypothetical protein
MHYGDEGVAKHLFLAEGQQEDVPPALGPVAPRDESGVFSTEQDIAADLADLPGEQSDGRSGDQDEQDLLEKKHRKFIVRSKIGVLSREFFVELQIALLCG